MDSVKKKAPYNLKSQIRSAMRRLWLYSPERREAMAAARIGRGIYRCKTCAAVVGPKLIQIDHIEKVTPAGGLNNWSDWAIFLERLFCGAKGLVALCKPCHAIKTKEERLGITTKKKTKKRPKRAGRPRRSKRVLRR